MIDFRGHHSRRLKRLQFMRYRLVNSLPGKYGLQQVIQQQQVIRRQQQKILDGIVIYCIL